MLWDRRFPTRRMVSPRPGKAAMRSSGSMIRITGRDTQSEVQISRMTGSSMSTNSARTWVPAVASAEAASPVRLQTSQKPAPNCRGSTANPSPWRHEGKRARHGTEHPQFGDINHAQGLGCVDACPSSRCAATTAAQRKTRLRRRQHQNAPLRFEGAAALDSASHQRLSSLGKCRERRNMSATVAAFPRRRSPRPVPGQSIPVRVSSKRHR